MIKFLARRLAQMAILFVVFLSLVWLLLQAMPGDIANTFVGNPDIPPEVRAQIRENLGLDRPLHLQYLTYITNFFRGEWGVSFSRYPQDVSAVIGAALPRTLVLFLTATLFAFWLGFKSGKVIAWGRGGSTEQGFIIGGVFLQTVFYPWFAIVMLWTFGFFPPQPGYSLLPFDFTSTVVQVKFVFANFVGNVCALRAFEDRRPGAYLFGKSW